MSEDNPEAMRHPLIADFVNRVDSEAEDGIPTLSLIQKPEFMPFWPHMIVHSYQDEQQDFLTTFYGTHVVSMYGQDCTGKMMTEMGFGDAVAFIRKRNKEVLESKTRAYASFGIFWQERDHLTLYQVKMPLRRKSASIKDVLVCMSIE